MSVYGKLLHIYNDCRRNGQWAKLVLETTNGQEHFTFSSRKPAHRRAAGHPNSGNHQTTGNHYQVASKTPQSAAGTSQSAAGTSQSAAGSSKPAAGNPQSAAGNPLKDAGNLPSSSGNPLTAEKSRKSQSTWNRDSRRWRAWIRNKVARTDELEEPAAAPPSYAPRQPPSSSLVCSMNIETPPPPSHPSQDLPPAAQPPPPSNILSTQTCSSPNPSAIPSDGHTHTPLQPLIIRQPDPAPTPTPLLPPSPIPQLDGPHGCHPVNMYAGLDELASPTVPSPLRSLNTSPIPQVDGINVNNAEDGDSEEDGNSDETSESEEDDDRSTPICCLRRRRPDPHEEEDSGADSDALPRKVYKLHQRMSEEDNRSTTPHFNSAGWRRPTRQRP